MVELNPTSLDPPPTTPTQLFAVSVSYGLLFSLVWSQLGNAPINALVRSFFNMSPEQYDAMNFGAPDSNKTAVQAIYH